MALLHACGHLAAAWAAPAANSQTNLNRALTELSKTDSLIVTRQGELISLHANLLRLMRDSAATAARAEVEAARMSGILRETDDAIGRLKEERDTMVSNRGLLARDSVAAYEKWRESQAAFRREVSQSESLIGSTAARSGRGTAEADKIRIDSSAVEKNYRATMVRLRRERVRVDSLTLVSRKRLDVLVTARAQARKDSTVAARSALQSRSALAARRTHLDSLISAIEHERDVLLTQKDKAGQEALAAQSRRDATLESLKRTKDKLNTAAESSREAVKTLKAEIRRLRADSSLLANTPDESMERLKMEMRRVDAEIAKRRDEQRPFSNILDAQEVDRKISTRRMELDILMGLSADAKSKKQDAIQQKQQDLEHLEANRRRMLLEAASAWRTLGPDTATPQLAGDRVERIVAQKEGAIAALQSERGKLSVDSAGSAERRSDGIDKIHQAVVDKAAQADRAEMENARAAAGIVQIAKDSLEVQRAWRKADSDAKATVRSVDARVAAKAKERSILVAKHPDLASDSLVLSQSAQKAAAKAAATASRVDPEIALLRAKVALLAAQKDRMQSDSLVAVAQRDQAVLKYKALRSEPGISSNPTAKPMGLTPRQREESRQDSLAYETAYRLAIVRYRALLKRSNLEIAGKARDLDEMEAGRRRLVADGESSNREAATISAGVRKELAQRRLVIAQKERVVNQLRKRKEVLELQIEQGRAAMETIAKREQGVAPAIEGRKKTGAGTDVAQEQTRGTEAVPIRERARRPSVAAVTESTTPTATGTPAVVASSPRVVVDEAKRAAAENYLMQIYDLIGRNRVEEAYRLFKSKLDLIEKHVDPEALAAVSMALMEAVKTGEKSEAAVLGKKGSDQPSTSADPPPATASAPEPAAVPTTPCIDKDATIFIASLPPFADASIDGEVLGKTNTSDFRTCSGSRTLRLMYGESTCVQTITLQPGANPSILFRVPCE